MSSDWSRRKLLYHAGICISLPYLEALMGMLPKAHAAIPNKQRFIGIFFANGVNPATWRYGSGGVLDELKPNGVNNNFMIFRGARNSQKAEDTHMNGTAGLLSCSQVRGGKNSRGQYNLSCGESVDQVIAKKVHLAGSTVIPSIQLGWKYRPPYEILSRYHPDYSNCISWKSATQPMRPIYSTSKAFDALFAAGAESNYLKYIRSKDKSILDFVMGQTQDLHKRLPAADQHRLTGFLDQVRDLEKRVTSPPPECPAKPGRGGYTSSGDCRDHLLKMNELTVLAMKCNITRVATLMYEPSIDGLNYRGGSHGVAHASVNGGSNLSYYLEHRRHTLKLLNHLVSRLKAEGLLDGTVVIASSDMSQGNHTRHDLPVLMASGGAGLKLGQTIGNAGTTRPLAGLYVDVMKMFGIQKSTFGQAGDQGVGKGGEWGIFT